MFPYLILHKVRQKVSEVQHESDDYCFKVQELVTLHLREKKIQNVKVISNTLIHQNQAYF